MGEVETVAVITELTCGTSEVLVGGEVETVAVCTEVSVCGTDDEGMGGEDVNLAVSTEVAGGTDDVLVGVEVETVAVSTEVGIGGADDVVVVRDDQPCIFRELIWVIQILRIFV